MTEQLGEKIQNDLLSVTDCVREIDTKNLITNDEIVKIYNGMDKSDYGSFFNRINQLIPQANINKSNKKKWLDINKLTKKIVEIKSSNYNLILDSVKLIISLERYPPINSYEITFKNSNNTTILQVEHV